MWGVQSDFTIPFAQSGWVHFLDSGAGCTNDSLSSPDYPLKSSEVIFGSWAEPDSYWSAEDGFNDGKVEPFQQLLRQVELPQLAKEVQPLLGLFYNGLNMIVPLQVLRNCGAQESEWLHCRYSDVHDGEWGRARGISPEVHDHLHSFEDVELQVVKTAPDSQLLKLLSVSRLVTSWMMPISVVSYTNFRSLTEGSLDVQSFV